MCMDATVLLKDEDKIWMQMFFLQLKISGSRYAPVIKTTCDSRNYLAQDKAQAVIGKLEIKEN